MNCLATGAGCTARKALACRNAAVGSTCSTPGALHRAIHSVINSLRAEEGKMGDVEMDGAQEAQVRTPGGVRVHGRELGCI